MKSLRLKNVFLPLAALAFATSANATIITSTATGSGGGGLYINSSGVATGNPANPPNGPWQLANTVYYNEDFTGPAVGGAIFDHDSYPTAIEYSVTLVVNNTSGLTWSGYKIYVGSGNIQQPIYTNWFTIGAGFIPTISVPGTLDLTDNNWVEWSGLNVPDQTTVTMQFNFDLIANTWGQWQIQQQPIAVPEPASLSCFALGALLLLRGRNRM